ncbi:MAG: hypothetical protein LBT59_01820 [Clostridiales bacterium]|jgi:hypothetical protein|nr:hypothetical protein [Clostridiales bacterium]
MWNRKRAYPKINAEACKSPEVKRSPGLWRCLYGNLGYVLKACALIFFCFSALCACAKSELEARIDESKASIERFASLGYTENLALQVLTLGKPTIDDKIYLDNINDDLHIIISSKTTNDFNCKLKLMIDYVETDFIIDSKTLNSYVFPVKSSDALEIVVNLPDSLKFDHHRILTAIVIPNSDIHVSDGYSDIIPALAKDFELIPSRSEEGSISVNSNPDYPVRFLDIQYQGLMLNSDLELSSTAHYPHRSLEAKGESVKVGYYAGNYDNSDDMLILLLLNGESILIHDKPFIHLINEPGKIAYGVIEFKTPEVPGKYELTGFVTKSPYQTRNRENATYYDASIPFTIIVD